MNIASVGQGGTGQSDIKSMANAVRALAMDSVEKAKSGHPGMPMGMADVATVLFTRFLKIDPAAPDWPDRDRFVLSAGHGDALSFGGLWKFLGQHKRMCWEEIKRSFSKQLFCESLQRLVPDVRMQDLETGGAGVRAQAMSPDGTLVQDFSFVRGRKALHVLNAPSPAATASFAIGGEIASQLDGQV